MGADPATPRRLTGMVAADSDAEETGYRAADYPVLGRIGTSSAQAY